MSLHGRMVEVAKSHPRASPSRLAELFLGELSKADLRSLLTSEFKHIERSLVVGVESALARKPIEVRTLEGQREALKSLLPLLTKPYRTGDGRERLAGQMTDQDWAMREVMLGAHRQGVERAEATCRRARELIAACNVECLTEAAQVCAEDVAEVLAEAEAEAQVVTV